jgi:hypothetical protein
MQLSISEDGSVGLDVKAIAAGFAAAGTGLTVTALPEVKLPGEVVKCPETYGRLEKPSERGVLRLIFTSKPYDNNYFWESNTEGLIIVSLSGWRHLTDLPPNNGAVYFVCATAIRRMGIGSSHRDRNTGCINDFWEDKRGVDAGMRSAFLCVQCSGTRKLSEAEAAALAQIRVILDELSRASRSRRDVCDAWQTSDRSLDDGHKSVALGPRRFDVFLCHNSKDKPAVRRLDQKLKKEGVKTWFDEEQLPPGRPWQPALESQIETIGAVAVLVGESGLGPWQDAEMRGFISEFVTRNCAVIPVILSGCAEVPTLPIFLKQFTWVDFRKRTPDPFDRLVWGITGSRRV